MAKAVSSKPAPKSSGVKTKSASTKATNKSSTKTSVKSADIKSSTPSERAKDILRNNEIKDGIFKSRSDATVGDIAQAAVMKENGIDPDSPDIKLDPKEVQAKVYDIIKNNDALAKAAEEAGINLDNPTEEDLQALSNLDVKAGQEIDVAKKKNQDIDEPEKPNENEEAGGCDGAGGAGEAGGAEEAGDNKDKMQTLQQIIDLINKAESAAQKGDTNSANQSANQALQLINQLRQEAGDAKGYKPGKQGKDVDKLVNKINSPAKLNTSSLSKELASLEGNDLNKVLDALEARVNKVKAKTYNPTMNYLGLTAQQNKVLTQLGLKEPIAKLLQRPTI